MRRRFWQTKRARTIQTGTRRSSEESATWSRNRGMKKKRTGIRRTVCSKSTTNFKTARSPKGRHPFTTRMERSDRSTRASTSGGTKRLRIIPPSFLRSRSLSIWKPSTSMWTYSPTTCVLTSKGESLSLLIPRTFWWKNQKCKGQPPPVCCN